LRVFDYSLNSAAPHLLQSWGARRKAEDHSPILRTA
jgi:hypothetical protein